MKVELLHYRPWQGTFRQPAWALWPIARMSLGLLFRRKLFWLLYSVSLLIFLMFFFGGFLLDWSLTQMPSQTVKIGDTPIVRPERLIRGIRRMLQVLNGSQDTFAFFFNFQSEMVMVTLALTGALVVGKDYVEGSVPFFLAKPISRWHYILGKCLAVAVVVHMLTTLPAIVLYGQHALSDWQYLVDPDYFQQLGGSGPASLPLLLGILGYGLLLSIVLSIMLTAVASWVQRTMPLILVWTSIFLFLDILTDVLVDRLHYTEHLRLFSMWNNLKIVGRTLLGIPLERIRPQPQPPLWEVVVVILLVLVLCLSYLNRRTRAVEIVK